MFRTGLTHAFCLLQLPLTHRPIRVAGAFIHVQVDSVTSQSMIRYLIPQRRGAGVIPTFDFLGKYLVNKLN